MVRIYLVFEKFPWIFSEWILLSLHFPSLPFFNLFENSSFFCILFFVFKASDRRISLLVIFFLLVRRRFLVVTCHLLSFMAFHESAECSYVKERSLTKSPYLIFIVESIAEFPFLLFKTTFYCFTMRGITFLFWIQP